MADRFHAGGGAAAAALAAAAFALVLFGLRAEVRSRAGRDDSYYLLQGSSLIEDGDLDLRNDILASGFALPDRLELLTAVTASGSLDNDFSVGPALLWAPAYVAGLPLRHTEPGQAPVRWTRSQRDALHLLSLLLLAGVIFFMFRLYALCCGGEAWDRAGPPGTGPWREPVRGGFRPPRGIPGMLPVAALVLGTPLLVYATSVYTMSHLPSAAAAALLIAAALQLERTPRPAVALLAGAAAGLTFLMRWQDLIFGLLLAVPLWRRRPWRRSAVLALCAGLGFLAVASVQLHAWRLERGSWLTVPQGGGFFNWGRPELAGFLFSGRSGLLAWAPVFGLAAAGLLLPWRCRLSRRWAVAALLVLAAEIYVNAAAGDWWGGHSFGARRMASCVPLLPLGLANLRQWLARIAALPLLLCCAWGVFAGQLYWSGVQDLSLVLRGAPSVVDSKEPAESDVVNDPVEARARIGRLALSPPADYWAVAGEKPSWRGIAATWLLIGAVTAVLTLALARAAPRRVLAAALGCALAAALGAHLRLALGPHPVAAERAGWARLAKQWQAPPRQFDRRAVVLPPHPEGWPGSPLDAYRYLWTFLEWRGGDPAQARALLAALAARGYPAATAASAALQAAERDGEAVRWIPGTFFQPVRGRPSLELALPPAAAGRRSWQVAFDLTPGELVAGELHDLLHLVGAHGEPLADLAARGVGGGRGGGLLLATPRGRAEGPATAARTEIAGGGCRLESGKRTRLDVRYGLAPALASVTAACAAGPAAHLEVPALAAGPPAELAFGRLRSRRLGPFSLRGTSFADLWVIAQR
jgi:hypothetical protein